MSELRFTTAGESHGPGLVAIVEGLPAGLELDRERIDADMARRQLGHGRGGRMKIERDSVEVRSGVRHGRTLGGPIAMLVANRDYPNWEERMNPWPVDVEVEESHLPRPGHADLAGLHKYGFTDVRNVLERASARETAARVAAGALAKEFLRALGVSVHSHVLQICSVTAPARDDLSPDDFAGVDDSPVRVLDKTTEEAMVDEINRMRKANESLGGVFEVRAFGLTPGLGSHVSWEERLDSRLAQAIVSIQAVKGVSVGEAWDVAGSPGSESHDEIFYSEERGWHRQTNRAGGVEGGMTNGMPLVVKGALKPISTLTKPLRSVDTETKEPAQAMRERTDSTVVPAAGVVAEAMVALVLARCYREKFGGDHIDDVTGAIRAYEERIRVAALNQTGGQKPTIAFVGFMGAGKTRAAKGVAAVLGEPAVDVDAEIERELGAPPAGVFERDGEARFREVEERIALKALAEGGLVSLGGGAVESERIRAALAGCFTAWCRISEEAAWARCEDTSRPLAQDRDEFARRFTARQPLYESVANAVLTDGGERIGRLAAGWLRAAARLEGARFAWASSASGDYPAIVGAGALGLLDEVGARRAELDDAAASDPGRWFAVADRHALAHHRQRLPATAQVIEVDGGEASKTLQQAESVLRALAQAGARRDDGVLAFGGGVVGDLAGFCAATYQRGVPVAHAPSTLVAQVDSAYGGKTGVDLPEAKNYAGAYHMPHAVLADPAVLATLPEAEMAAGFAEVVKTALIAGGPLWEEVRGLGSLDPEALGGVIFACARTKIDVVAADERDTSRRQVLNLGHTVGHAIESATSYGRYRHGEAIGLGMLAALRLSGADALGAEVADLLDRHGLPTTLDSTIAPDDVLAAIARDKKADADGVPFVLVREPGDVVTGERLDGASVRTVVEELKRV